MELLWLIIGIVVVVVILGFVFRRARKNYIHMTSQEKAKKTVEDILIETGQATKEELDKMSADEKVNRWKELYGEDE